MVRRWHTEFDRDHDVQQSNYQILEQQQRRRRREEIIVGLPRIERRRRYLRISPVGHIALGPLRLLQGIASRAGGRATRDELQCGRASSERRARHFERPAQVAERVLAEKNGRLRGTEECPSRCVRGGRRMHRIVFRVIFILEGEET